MQQLNKISNGVKVLNLSLDSTILDEKSAAAGRILEYGRLVDKYWLIVAAKEKKIIDLSDCVRVYGASGAAKLLKLLRVYLLGRKILKNNEFDVITVQDPYYLGLVGLRLSRKFDKGFELQIHGWEKFSGLRALIAKYVINRANSIRVVSQRLKKQLVENFGVSEEKIITVPIYTEIKDQLRDESPKTDFIFLTIGRLVPIKNIKMQIKAMAEIVKQYKNIKLWIIGEGEEKERLLGLAAKLGLAEKVKFLGRQPDLNEYFKKADVFLLTSDYEGWGLAVIEAASWGLPIIMTDVGCAQEVIKDQESGLIIPVGDQKKLESAMTKLIENYDLGKKLGQNAKEAVKKLPGKEETLRLYRKSWEQALTKKS